MNVISALIKGPRVSLSSIQHVMTRQEATSATRERSSQTCHAVDLLIRPCLWHWVTVAQREQETLSFTFPFYLPLFTALKGTWALCSL